MTARSRKMIEFGTDEPSNLRIVLDEPNTLGLGACKKYGRTVSDLDVGLTPPSTTASILEFDGDGLRDAPLCIICRASFDSYYCDGSSNQLYENGG